MGRILALTAMVVLVVCGGLAAQEGEGAPALESTGAPATVMVDATAAQVDAESTAAQVDTSAELDAVLARMDERTKNIRTMQAELVITKIEEFSGRKSQRAGTVYMRKPSDLYVELSEQGYPRRVWVSDKRLVDYRPDLKSAIEVALDGGGQKRPVVLGLATTAKELRENFHLTLEPPAENPETYTIKLAPRDERDFGFTSAEIVLDAKTLAPRQVIQRKSDLEEVETFDISGVKENPRLRDSVFEPNLPRGTSVDTYEAGKWKGI